MSLGSSSSSSKESRSAHGLISFEEGSKPRQTVISRFFKRVRFSFSGGNSSSNNSSGSGSSNGGSGSSGSGPASPSGSSSAGGPGGSRSPTATPAELKRGRNNSVPTYGGSSYGSPPSAFQLSSLPSLPGSESGRSSQPATSPRPASTTHLTDPGVSPRLASPKLERERLDSVAGSPGNEEPGGYPAPGASEERFSPWPTQDDGPPHEFMRDTSTQASEHGEVSPYIPGARLATLGNADSEAPDDQLASGFHRIIRKLRRGDEKAPVSRRDYWMKDEACKECYDCKTPFSTFRRKHHCRICGQIFCYRCASNTIPGESLGFVGFIRVCDYCLNVMRSYSENQESPPSSPRPPSTLLLAARVRPRSIYVEHNESAPFRGTEDVNDEDSDDDSDYEEENYNTLTPQLLLQSQISRPSTPVKDEDRRRTFFHRRRSLPTRTSVVLTEFWLEPDTSRPLLDPTSMAHLKRLIQQLTARRGLSTAWEQVMYDMAAEVCQKVSCTAQDMDVRHFIKFKKVPGAKPADTFFLSGAATKKTLAHRKMRQTMQNPRILILTFPLEYNRVQDQFISINPVISQEQEHLLNLCNRLLALEPHVILVEKTVARIALEYLYQMGVSVAYNIKLGVLENISRFTGADIITSIDKLALSPAVGTCGTFQMQMFAHGRHVTPLMVFDGCPPDLGGCIILRGEDTATLRVVKQIMSFVLFAMVSLHRESSLYQTLHSRVALPSAASAPLPPAFDDDLLNKLLTPYQALLSTSPGVIFPPPYLIERYRKEVMNRKQRSYNLSRLVSASPAPAPGQQSLTGSGNSSHAHHHHRESTTSGIDRVSRDALNYILESEQAVSPIAHQSIIFLSCTITDSAKCAVPHLQYIEYYGNDDMTLAAFVEHVVETAAIQCSQCQQSALRHRRIYYHGSKSVTITVTEDAGALPVTVLPPPAASSLSAVPTAQGEEQQQQHPPILLPPGVAAAAASIPLPPTPMSAVPNGAPPSNGTGGASSTATTTDLAQSQLLYVQTICRECGTVGPRRRVPPEAAAFSFAKYLELAFYSDGATSTRCEHGTFTALRHCYSLGGYTVHIDVNPIALYEVSLPGMHVYVDGARVLAAKDHARAQVCALVDSVYMSVDRCITQHLHQVTAAAGGNAAPGVVSTHATGNGGVGSMGPSAGAAAAAALVASPTSAAPSSPIWAAASFTAGFTAPPLPPAPPSGGMFSMALTTTAAPNGLDESVFRDLCVLARHEKQEMLDMCNALFESTPVHDNLAFNSVIRVLMDRSSVWMDQLAQLKQMVATASAPLDAAGGSGLGGGGAGNGGDGSGGTIGMAAPGWLLRALQEMAQDHRRVAPKVELPTPSTSPISRPLLLLRDSPQLEPGDELSSPVSPTGMLLPVLDKEEELLTRPSSARADRTDLKKSSGIVQSLVNLLTSGSSAAAALSPLTAILSPTEHMFQGNPVIIREDEPTSIVAFAHCSTAYLGKLEALGRRELASDTPMSEMSVSPFREIQAQEVDVDVDVDEDTLGETWLDHDPGARGHIDVECTEGPLKIGCRTYFASEFHQLRQHCGIEAYFTHSMSRCHAWDASGGKSGSTFLKTQDDRFVIKQISKMELELFTLFAPSYFAYMNKAIFNQIPTILAKIFGVYRVALKNSTTGKSIKLDFLVMEHLWYNKKITRLFDLKGSTRNRHVPVAPPPPATTGTSYGSSSGMGNGKPAAASGVGAAPSAGAPPPQPPLQVLLDGNFIEMTHMAPLFTREYSRKVLATSIYNDTLFLSKLNIMDYSLLVGIDETNQELVVGIVDFIRTYTWDKKLESWVKETGLLGGGKEPTIVSPKQYKTRFREAMDRYFLLVPDKFCTAKVGVGAQNLFS
ncbi:Mitochondrial distribution and morphology protein 12 [Blastocladiella emersonii ATCC 22665]|nr:Mitochondrial distribution and morphology protein 12 [Blastocladiella emersonii ATCC 22665]